MSGAPFHSEVRIYNLTDQPFRFEALRTCGRPWSGVIELPPRHYQAWKMIGQHDPSPYRTLVLRRHQALEGYESYGFLFIRYPAYGGVRSIKLEAGRIYTFAYMLDDNGQGHIVRYNIGQTPIKPAAPGNEKELADWLRTQAANHAFHPRGGVPTRLPLAGQQRPAVGPVR